MSLKNVEDFYPLSPMQQGMLFHSLYAPESGVYVGQLRGLLRSDLDLAAFQGAWQRVMDRHAILRTAFVTADLKEPVQVVHRQVRLPVEQQDWRGLSPGEQEARLEAFLREDARRGFEHARPPLMRLTLLRLAEREYRFIWTYHHLLFDGWSLPLILRDVIACYEGLHEGREVSLPPARPFRAYIAWLKNQDMAAAEAYWRQTLQGFTAPTPIPLPSPEERPVEGSPAAGLDPRETERGTLLPAAVTTNLQQFARRHGLTLNTLVQGAWALLLAHYSGERDVLFGATVSGRPADLPGAEQMVGLFINTLPVRVTLSPEQPLLEWLQELQARQAQLRQYEYSPLVQIQSWSEVPRGLPLFESILVFENFPVAAALQEQSPGSALAIDDVHEVQKTNFPITLVAYPGPELALRIAYDPERFAEAAVDRMLGHLGHLLESFARDPRQPVGAVPLLTEAQRRQVLCEWNETSAPFPHDRCIHDLFEAQVERTPEAPAVRFEGTELTYRELNCRANRLARYLQGLGVGPETLVGLCLDASLERVIAVLAVLKAGGAYLPLDPSYPMERISFMLDDARAPLLLTQADFADRIAASRPPSPRAPRILCLDRDWPEICRESDANPESGAGPETLAYCIYTSGSTGRPKGALLLHRGLANLAPVLIDTFALTPHSRVLQFASFSFDASLSEILMALLSGATLVLAPHHRLASPQELHALLQQERITTVTLPPSLLAVLPTQGLEELETVVSAGEVCSWEVAARWSGGRRFLNGYGPTETTVAASYYEVGERVAGTRSVPLGRPMANVRMYVLDGMGEPAPVGVWGELYIGGAGVGRGYLNRAELTQERFVPDRFSGEGRLYRTGDRVRYLPDGNLEFGGRLDDQVKIRGIRIEMGEIEAALVRHPEVQNAVVVAREEARGDRRLVAYVVLRRDGESGGMEVGRGPDGLRGFLREHLPDPMIPSAFLTLESLPLLPNGKVDRRALMTREDGDLDRERKVVEPRTATEDLLAGIWSRVLGVERVGIKDNFFELGGHSLLATQITARIRDAFQVELPLSVLFETESLADLARRVEQSRMAARGLQLPALRPRGRASRADLGGEEVERLPLSFAQQRLWFLDQLEPGSPRYNIPGAVRLCGALDVAVLERCLAEVVRRHEILRTRILTVDGRPWQVVDEAARVALPVVDLSALSPDERETEVGRRAIEEAQSPFDLGRAPLMRASLLRLAESEHVALFTMHHIVSDGWSLGVLVHELVRLYSAFQDGRPSPLPELPIQYADYAAWQREWLQGEALSAQLAYWKQQLAGSPPLLELPTDSPRPPVQTFNGASLGFALPRALSDRLAALSRKSNATLFMTLMAAFKVLLFRYSNQTDISVGTPIAGRDHAEVEGLIGFFVNTLVMRSDLSGDPSFCDLLKRVRATALTAYAHQEVSFEMVVDALQPDRNMSSSPLFQVMFAFQNTPLRAEALPGLQIEPVETHSKTAKFDLTLEMAEGPDGLVGAFEYNTDLFEASTIEQMARHFHTLLEGLLDQPLAPLSSLPLLHPNERDALLRRCQPRASFPSHFCLHQRFQEIVRRFPHAPALSFEGQHLSYDQLNRRANQLAHRLLQHRLEPDTLVGICLERSPEMVIALLAVLKAGAAYLPLDPSYPHQRLAFMLDDAQVPLVLTHSSLRDRLPHDGGEGSAPRLLCLDTDAPAIAQQPDLDPVTCVTPDHLAYCIYTSGSTGRPKGVLVSHRNVARLFTATDPWFGFDERQVWTLFHSIAFDFSVWEVWGALLYGGRLVVAPYLVSRSPEAFYALLEQEQVTVLNQTPSAFGGLAEVAGRRGVERLSLRWVIFGGEALEEERLVGWWAVQGAGGPRLVNMYGITETTVHVTYREVRAGEGGVGSGIGEAIPDLGVYVLDERGEPAPVGVWGELYVGGAGVARGYLNRPELTGERFVANRFGEGVLYRTGDRGRYRWDGKLEYGGRVDEQVKVRGFRIEPGEIAAALVGEEGVREAAVVAREEAGGEKRLVAYVVGSEEGAPSASELRRRLKEKLPEYLVPAAIVFVEALPLTANGKLDRKALPAPESARPELETPYRPPTSPAEVTLASIWGEVLGLERVGVEDNFFELGGDSILSIQVIARANQAGLGLTPRQLFEHPTIAGLASVANRDAPVEAEQGLVTGPAPLTPIQRWFFEQHPINPHHWNTSMLLTVTSPLDPEILKQCTGLLLAHHDALRLRYERCEAGWRQTHADPGEEIPFTWIDLATTPRRRQSAVIEAEAARMQTSLSLTDGPMMRVVYFTLGAGGPGRLLLLFHHLVVDGVSLRILLEEFQRLYGQLARGDRAQLPPKTSSFQAWATALVRHARSAEIQKELEYWRRLGERSWPRLPVEYPEGANRYGDAGRVIVSLSEAETRTLLQEVPATTGATVEAVLLTALVECLVTWTGERALLVEMEGHGREQIAHDLDVSRTVGWFTSIFPLGIALDSGEISAAPDARGAGKRDLTAALAAVAAQLRAVPNRGLGYGLLRYLCEEESIRAQMRALPAAEVNFNYLGRFEPGAAERMPVGLAPESAGAEHSPNDRRGALLYVVGVVTGGSLDILWSYSTRMYRRKRIERLGRAFLTELRRILAMGREFHDT